MLVLENVPIYGHYDQVTENPPDVLLELFDYDPVVSLIVMRSKRRQFYREVDRITLCIIFA